MPDSGKTKTTKSGNDSLEIKAQASDKTGGESTAKADQAAPEPVPLDLRCDGHMLVTFPEPRLPVKEGPPAPAPTLVHFERNVVVRRGQLSKLPAQLNCDNLDLTLVQADKTASERGAQGQTTSPGSSTGGAATASQAEVTGEGQTTRRGQTSDQGQSSAQGPTLAAADGSQAAENPGSQADGKPEDKGALGDLTLQRLKATGHAVWVQLPAEGLKIRMNELIHKVTGPGQSLTLAHGDATRKIMIEKYDFTEERPEGPDGPVVRKPQSVTHVWAVDATMEDSGGGMDTSNLTAYGPGLLETRPVPSQADNPLMNVPPDRTAVWQDLLLVKNLLGPDKKIVERRIVLKGRPKVFDRVKEASLDSVELITAWLEPCAGKRKDDHEHVSPDVEERAKRRRIECEGGQFPDQAAAGPTRRPPGGPVEAHDRPRRSRCLFHRRVSACDFPDYHGSGLAFRRGKCGPAGHRCRARASRRRRGQRSKRPDRTRRSKGSEGKAGRAQHGRHGQPGRGQYRHHREQG